MDLPDYGTSKLANFVVQWITRKPKSHLLNPPGMSCERGVFTTNYISATETSLTNILDNQTSQLSLSLLTTPKESGGPGVIFRHFLGKQHVVFMQTFDSVPPYIPKRPLRATPPHQLRGLLSLLLTPALSPEIDEICASKLGVLMSCGRLDHS